MNSYLTNIKLKMEIGLRADNNRRPPVPGLKVIVKQSILEVA